MYNGSYSHVLIMGDLNFPETDWENRTCKTFNSEDENRLLSKVRKNLASEGQALNCRRLKNQIRKLTRQGKKFMEKNIAKQNKATICFGICTPPQKKKKKKIKKIK